MQPRFGVPDVLISNCSSACAWIHARALCTKYPTSRAGAYHEPLARHTHTDSYLVSPPSVSAGLNVHTYSRSNGNAHRESEDVARASTGFSQTVSRSLDNAYVERMYKYLGHAITQTGRTDGCEADFSRPNRKGINLVRDLTSRFRTPKGARVWNEARVKASLEVPWLGAKFKRIGGVKIGVHAVAIEASPRWRGHYVKDIDVYFERGTFGVVVSVEGSGRVVLADAVALARKADARVFALLHQT
jgi:hypothetical protein